MSFLAFEIILLRKRELVALLKICFSSRVEGKYLASKMYLSPPVASAAVHSNLVNLFLLLIHCLLLLPLGVGF